MRTLIFSAALTFLPLAPAHAVELTIFEATLRGFPVLRDASGKKLADGDFSQWLEKGKLHVKLVYHFAGNHFIEQKGEFRQRSELIQDWWSWREVKGRQELRRFEVDFRSRRATAAKRDGKELKRWSEEVEIEQGRTFAGFGFILAIKNLRRRLMAGENIELNAVAFMPQPRVAAVEIFYAGLDRMQMADRNLTGSHYIIRAKIPKVAQLFMSVPDTHIWLNHPPPAGFLRAEGPLMELEDPMIRMDVLPGGQSGQARPAPEAERSSKR